MAAPIGTLMVNVVAKTDKFAKAMKSARSRMAALASHAKLAGVAAVGAAGSFVAFAVKTASEMETVETQLGTMLGTAEKARAMMADLRRFAAGTPFQFPDIAQGARQLLAYGVEAGAVTDRLKMLGDIASGSGARLTEIVSIFGKMKSSGVVALGDLNQLGDRGIPIFTALKAQLGLSGAELRKFVSTGKLGFNEVTLALQGLTDQGGIFHNSMQAQSETLAGRWSTLKDNIVLVTASIGKQLLPMVTEGVTMFTIWIQSIGDLESKFRTFGKIVYSVFTILMLPIRSVLLVIHQITSMVVTAITKMVNFAQWIFDILPGQKLPDTFSETLRSFDAAYTEQVRRGRQRYATSLDRTGSYIFGDSKSNEELNRQTVLLSQMNESMGRVADITGPPVAIPQ